MGTCGHAGLYVSTAMCASGNVALCSCLASDMHHGYGVGVKSNWGVCMCVQRNTIDGSGPKPKTESKQVSRLSNEGGIARADASLPGETSARATGRERASSG